jgi:LL-diaminopimelate aminotransferase
MATETNVEVRAADRVLSIGAYAFAEVDAAVERLRASGIRSIDFGVGDPTVPTPDLVRRATQHGVDARAASGYPSYIGAREFREAAAAWIARRFGARIDPAREICATIGSKEAIFHSASGFVNPGDWVIAPTPGYPPVARGTLFAGGRTWFVPLRRESAFLPDLDAIPAEVLDRARILWINYPHNPTGACAPRRFFEEAAAFAARHGLLLFSDEAYSEIWFDEKPPSALELAREGVASFFSLSKRSAMTGYRVGFVAGDSRVIDVLKKVKTNVDSGTPTFIQDGAIAALSDEAHVEAFRRMYLEKRDLLVGALRSIGLADCTPAGTLYVWQETPRGMSSVEFAKRLLDPDVACVATPGSWLADALPDGSNPGEGFVRFALVPTREEIVEAAARLRRLRL